HRFIGSSSSSSRASSSLSPQQREPQESSPHGSSSKQNLRSRLTRWQRKSDWDGPFFPASLCSIADTRHGCFWCWPSPQSPSPLISGVSFLQLQRLFHPTCRRGTPPSCLRSTVSPAPT